MATRIIALILGILAALGGLATAALGAVGAIASDREADRFTLGASLIPSGVLVLAIGAALAWLAARAMQGQESRPVALPPWWASLALVGVALGAGWAALWADLWWLFFPLATVAVLAPIAAVGALALPRRAPRPSWRRIVPAFAWGALVTPILAIALEVLAVLGAVIAAGLGLALAGQDALDTLARTVERLQGRALTEAQTQALLQVLLRQPLVLALGVFTLSFVAPVAEEFGKFGAVLLFARGRPRAGAPAGGARTPDSALTVFLIGLASGLGFAAIENVFYATQSGAEGWAGAAALRAATPVMHGTASALFALGWARQGRDPRGWGLVRGALAATALHGAWNFLAGAVAVVALLAPGGGGISPAALLTVPIVGVLVLLGLFSARTLFRLGRALGREAKREEAEEAAGPRDFTPAPPDEWSVVSRQASGGRDERAVAHSRVRTTLADDYPTTRLPD